MPVHKVGYRGWDGKPTPVWSRWWIITETGFRIAFKSTWVRRLLLVCWLPVLYWGLAVFLIEQTLERSNLLTRPEAVAVEGSENSPADIVESEVNRAMMTKFVDDLEDDFELLPQMDVLAEALSTGEEEHIRHTIWAWLLMMFFRYPQGTAVLFLLGFIAPSLISQDVRSRAFLLYFSRPIGRLEYILGKIFVPTTFLILITTLPAICLFFFGVTLSSDLTVLYSTWDIPIRILAASVCMIVPTCSLALMLSSVTQESRFATFAWFAVWALGHAAWLAIVLTQSARLNEAPFSDSVMNSGIVSDWSLVSLYNNLAVVQNCIFGFESFAETWPSFAVLAAVSGISLYLLYRGVSAPMNV